MTSSPSSADPARPGSRGLTALTLVLGLGILAYYVHQALELRFHNDDAYISFRYSRHLADGLGPVWNPGERVEGYTNFLWVVLVAAGMKLGFTAVPVADTLSILSGGLLLFAVAAFAARRTGWGHPAILLAPAILALHRSFCGWATSGMATMLFALLIFSGWSRVLKERESPGASVWPSSLLFAGAALTRPDGLLFGGLAGALLLLDVVRGRLAPARFLRWAAPITAIVAAHFLWRRLYYGFWLPNTFYAKVNSANPDRGVFYLQEYHDTYAIGWFLPLALLLVLRKPRDARAWLIVPLLAYLSYVVAVGGDTFEFRFLVYVTPMAYALVAEGIRRVGGLGPRGVGGLAAAALTVGMGWQTWLGGTPERAGDFDRQIRTFEELQRVATYNLEAGRELNDLLDRGLLPRDLVLCTATVGALPYVTRLETVDYHGLNDVRIARMPVAKEGRMAHEQEAPVEYLVERNVDVHLAGSRKLRRFPRVAFTEKLEKFRPYWRNVPIEGRYFSFASYVSEERFREVFGRYLPAGEDGRPPPGPPSRPHGPGVDRDDAPPGDDG